MSMIPQPVTMPFPPGSNRLAVLAWRLARLLQFYLSLGLLAAAATAFTGSVFWLGWHANTSECVALACVELVFIWGVARMGLGVRGYIGGSRVLQMWAYGSETQSLYFERRDVRLAVVADSSAPLKLQTMRELGQQAWMVGALRREEGVLSAVALAYSSGPPTWWNAALPAKLLPMMFLFPERLVIALARNKLRALADRLQQELTHNNEVSNAVEAIDALVRGEPAVLRVGPPKAHEGAPLLTKAPRAKV